MANGFISRAFRGRRRPDAPAGRLPPGRFVPVDASRVMDDNPSLIIVLLVNYRFTDPVLTSGQTVAKIEHIQELRDGVK